VAGGSAWKYLDDGSAPDAHWTGDGFDDSAWKSGAAELGYGDGDETTIVGFGGDASDKSITTYFRTTFDVADPAAVSALALRLIRDDGVVVYLNGAEIFRDNMPSGVIAHDTTASGPVFAEGETTWLTANLLATALRAGTNVIAVEIHQDRADSSDISFDLELKGIVPT
jgi:hypothetical protein